MNRVLISEDILADIANAIREKIKATNLIPVSCIGDIIRNMSYTKNLLEEYLDDTIVSYVDEEVASVGNYGFSYCSALESISLPAATSIGNYSFLDCTSLSSVNLPSVTSIGDKAFSDCSALTEIHFAAINQATIEALSKYSSKWGATNATIYFDL